MASKTVEDLWAAEGAAGPLQCFVELLASSLLCNMMPFRPPAAPSKHPIIPAPRFPRIGSESLRPTKACALRKQHILRWRRFRYPLLRPPFTIVESDPEQDDKQEPFALTSRTASYPLLPLDENCPPSEPTDFTTVACAPRVRSEIKVNTAI